MILEAPLEQPAFLPLNLEEARRLGWAELDIILISGDAYLDHPAQGPALLGRWLTAHGFRVGLLAQPDWRRPESFLKLGQPRLFAALSAGALDSMLAHYTAFRKKRRDDPLSPGGRPGFRPNRATLVYSGLARAAFPGKPVVIGGLEASLRRFVHYDFWQDKLRGPILLDAKADLLVYGPGERPLLALARRLAGQDGALAGRGWPGTAEAWPGPPPAEAVILPSLEEIAAQPFKLLEAALISEKLVHQGRRPLYQRAGGRGVLFQPPAEPLSVKEMDFLYQLPFSRRAHPGYRAPIPALTMLAASLTTHRGCGGGCSFCSLALHQGRRISSRSLKSVLAEAERLKIAYPKGLFLSDLGGPTANMWGAVCRGRPDECARVSCLWPRKCPNFAADQKRWLAGLKAVAALPGLKGVRVASGLRFDLLLDDLQTAKEFLGAFGGGQLKVAPEHAADAVLKLMRKPPLKTFEKFLAAFEELSPAGQFLVPYLISGFPGCREKDMAYLAAWLRRRNWRPRQVQSFIPTPGTVATAMYYAGRDPAGRPLETARSDRERQRQHQQLLNWGRKPAARKAPL